MFRVDDHRTSILLSDFSDQDEKADEADEEEHDEADKEGYGEGDYDYADGGENPWRRFLSSLLSANEEDH